MKRTSPELGDFTATPRVIPISLLAIGIGLLSTLVAWLLLRLIGFFTNVFYYGRAGTALVSPAGNHLGWFAVLIPVAGGLIVGFMAYYGSERIRGHGIPEALESILINGSKVQPRLAILKPLSSAISIGSGGPFGAEGPIIMTGGFRSTPPSDTRASSRAVVFRMAETGFTRMPVVEDGRLAGMVSLYDLLMARVRNLHEERTRERVLRLRLPFASHTLKE
jgi:hypothetical protein